MFYRLVNKDIRLELSVRQHARELLQLTDKNRNFLGRWLPVDGLKSEEDFRFFIDQQLALFAKGEAIHTTIFYQNQMAGVVSCNIVGDCVGTFGYWLGEEFNGKGIVTTCVKELIDLGVQYYGLNRFEIHCAADNYRSYAIPARLGFAKLGFSPESLLVYALKL